MTDIERKLIDDLLSKSLSKESFLNNFTVNVMAQPQYVLQLLEQAYNDKNPDDVEYVLFLSFAFNLFTKDYVSILCQLLQETWHYRHEDIARILQLLKAPESVEALYLAALRKFAYLEYNDSEALSVKCIWALGAINTFESRQKLELLTHSPNDVISENAKRQLLERQKL